MGANSTAASTPVRIEPEAWLNEHGDSLFRYALLRVRDAQTAEDIVQETFVSAYLARQTFQGRSSERTWLIGILKRKIYEHLRRSHRGQPLRLDWETEDLFNSDRHWDIPGGLAPADRAADPALMLDRRLLNETLHRCILLLPPRFGDVFVLRELEGFETQEICQLLDITPQNCWVILHRVRLQLRRCLEKAGFGLEN